MSYLDLDECATELATYRELIKEHEAGEHDAPESFNDECPKCDPEGSDAYHFEALVELEGELGDELASIARNYESVAIPEDEFAEYAEQLAYDIGAVSQEFSWPLSAIDWDEAAEQLKVDYSEFDFEGTKYLIRNW